jgi:hypothetical protein
MSKFTPGPWMWDVNTLRKELSLIMSKNVQQRGIV